jgi:hypothetical protein
MQEKRKEILEAILLLSHYKVKYKTFPKWIKIADLPLTVVYIIGYVLFAGWLTIKIWQILKGT